MTSSPPSSPPSLPPRLPRKGLRPLFRSLAAGAAALALAAPAPARELFWRSIDVVARIEPDGSLRVAETQALVMTGDWNGGERILRVAPGQSVRVERIVRIDPASGAETTLEQGELDRVDRWDWSDRSTVRWRSRLPSAPPFDRSLLVYRLELVYERIFAAEAGSAYALSHDFSFAQRDGEIERFSLVLDAAPGWSAAGALQVDGASWSGAFPARFEAGPLEPGRGFVVQGRLAWSGAEPPAKAARSELARSVRFALAAGVVVAALLFAVQWWRRDAALGRFASLTDPERIDAAWLETTLFAHRPEVVGALWDRSIGSAEVAAILARLVAEGRIASRVERKGWGPFGHEVLHLELLVPRDRFDADEKGLIAGLFPSGDATDTDSLRAHYRSRGFDPVSKIRTRLDQRVKAVSGFASGSPRPARRPTALLILGGLALIAVSPWIAPGGELAFLGVAGALLASIPGLVAAGVSRSRVGFPVAALVAIALSTTLLALVVVLLGALFVLPPTALVGAALLGAGLARAMFQTLSTPESAASMATRRDLASARRHFVAELGRESPRLEDRWFPWLVALGLAADCDRWARRFATAAGGASLGAGGHGTGWSSPGSSGGGWSGGGGSFGGAGASASFATAVSTMAAGVPAPSSSGSSGGGGGGGGGSSSGGGGGGGW